jgi:hypothetical protein
MERRKTLQPGIRKWRDNSSKKEDVYTTICKTTAIEKKCLGRFGAES